MPVTISTGQETVVLQNIAPGEKGEDKGEDSREKADPSFNFAAHTSPTIG
jgi:hypothetical protein